MSETSKGGCNATDHGTLFCLGIAVVKQVIADTGATGIKDMGKVMGLASKQIAGKADNKMIAEIVKRLLP